MCRYDYAEGVRRDDEVQEEAVHMPAFSMLALHMPSRPSMLDAALRLCEEEQRIHEEEQHWREQYDESYDDHDYTFYQDLNREFAGNYQQALDEAITV